MRRIDGKIYCWDRGKVAHIEINNLEALTKYSFSCIKDYMPRYGIGKSFGILVFLKRDGEEIRINTEDYEILREEYIKNNNTHRKTNSLIDKIEGLLEDKRLEAEAIKNQLQFHPS